MDEACDSSFVKLPLPTPLDSHNHGEQNLHTAATEGLAPLRKALDFLTARIGNLVL
jgi:hypothetical protein